MDGDGDAVGDMPSVVSHPALGPLERGRRHVVVVVVDTKRHRAAQYRDGHDDQLVVRPRDSGGSMTPTYYILEGDEIVPVHQRIWAVWFGSNLKDRIIARTVVRDGIEVSTVFLGLDHRFGQAGPPLLFETMVFGGLLDQEQHRYATIIEARAGHSAMVERVKRAEQGESI